MRKRLIIATTILALGLGGATYASSQETPTPVKASVVASPTVTELHTLINAERTKQGLQPLILDPKLNQSAADKCNDMVARGYFAHNTPDGQEPWPFIEKYTPEYKLLGENLAHNLNTSESVTNGWMTSPLHRENILKNYTNVGYAFCEGKSFSNHGTLVVQHFSLP